jgi:hypothetical protein
VRYPGMPSTAIRTISYDAPARRLAVTFITGRQYVYDGVPATVFHAFRTASSKGRFFNAEIRDRYAFREVIDLDHTRKRSA